MPLIFLPPNHLKCRGRGPPRRELMLDCAIRDCAPISIMRYDFLVYTKGLSCGNYRYDMTGPNKAEKINMWHFGQVSLGWTLHNLLGAFLLSALRISCLEVGQKPIASDRFPKTCQIRQTARERRLSAAPVEAYKFVPEIMSLIKLQWTQALSHGLSEGGTGQKKKNNYRSYLNLFINQAQLNRHPKSFKVVLPLPCREGDV